MAYTLGQQVYQILATVMETEVAKAHFNDPVNPERLGIPDYLEIIKEPMDLGTIRSRLVQGHYRHPSEVYGDVHLVWHNCRTYNDPDSALVAECNRLASFFEGMWRKLDFGTQQQSQAQASSAAPAGPPMEQLSFRTQLTQQFSAELQGAVPSQLSPRGSHQHHGARHKPPQAAAVGAAVAAAAAGASSLRSGHPLRRCLAVLELLLRHPAAEPLAHKVEPTALGFPDYYQSSRPLDLGTIKEKLEPGLENGWGTIAYKSTYEVLSDVGHVLHTWGSAASEDPSRPRTQLVEREFVRLWKEAGLPLEQPSPPASGAGPSTNAQPRSPLSLASPHATSPTAAAAAVHAKGHAHKRTHSMAQRSVAELSSADQAASAEISAGAAAAAVAAAAAAPAGSKRQRKGGAAAKGGGAPRPIYPGGTATRCDVCVRCKKGKCGTESAPKNCRKRVAKAAQAASRGGGGGGQGQLDNSSAAPSSAGGAEAGAAAHTARPGSGGTAQQQQQQQQSSGGGPQEWAEPSEAGTAAGTAGGTGLEAVTHTPELQVEGGLGSAGISGGVVEGLRPRRGKAGAMGPGSGSRGELSGMLTPTSAAAAAHATAVQMRQKGESGGAGGEEGPLGSALGVAAHSGSRGGKGARAKSVASPPSDAQESMLAPARERELLVAWARLQKKREQAAEAAAAAAEAARALLEAREVLQTVEELEGEEEEQPLGQDCSTPWPPGATFVPESYDVAAASAAASERCAARLLAMGAHWLAEGGPAAAAAAAAGGGGRQGAAAAAAAAVKLEGLGLRGGSGMLGTGAAGAQQTQRAQQATVKEEEGEGVTAGVPGAAGGPLLRPEGAGGGKGGRLSPAAALEAQQRLRQLVAQHGLQGLLQNYS